MKEITCFSGTRGWNVGIGCLVGVVWLLGAAGAVQADLSLDGLEIEGTYPGFPLTLAPQVTCGDGSAPAGVALRWHPIQPSGLDAALVDEGLKLPVESALAGTDTDLLGAPEIAALCEALGKLSDVETTAPGVYVVRGLVYAVGTCGDRRGTGCSGFGDRGYGLEFKVDCGTEGDGGDFEQKLHAPSTTGTKEPPEEELQIELAFDGNLEGDVSYTTSLDACDRQALRLSMGYQTANLETTPVTDVPLPGLGSEELGLFPARAAALPSPEVELDLLTVEATYVYFLRPKTRHLVPELSLGVGWAFADADERRLPAQLLPGDPLEGRGDDSLTANAGLRFRLNLERWGRRYVYFGVRGRWFEAREEDEVETQALFGMGLGLDRYH